MRCLVPALFALAALAACHDAPAGAPDAAPAPDARPPDAAPPIMVSGKVFAVVDFQVQPVAGAPIELRARTGDARIASTTTADDGSFSLSALGGAPLDASVVVALDGAAPTREWPAHPLVGGESLLVLVASPDELAAWYGEAGATFAADARTLLVAITDAAGSAAAGSTLAIAPGAPVVYWDDQAKRWDPSLTASTNGFALVADAPAHLTATATEDGAPLPPRDLTVDSGALTIAIVGP